MNVFRLSQVMDGLDSQLVRIADCADEERDIKTRLEVTARTNAEVSKKPLKAHLRNLPERQRAQKAVHLA